MSTFDVEEELPYKVDNTLITLAGQLKINQITEIEFNVALRALNDATRGLVPDDVSKSLDEWILWSESGRQMNQRAVVFRSEFNSSEVAIVLTEKMNGNGEVMFATIDNEEKVSFKLSERADYLSEIKEWADTERLRLYAKGYSVLKLEEG